MSNSTDFLKEDKLVFLLRKTFQSSARWFTQLLSGKGGSNSRRESGILLGDRHVRLS